MENPINVDDLGVPLFLQTPICTKKTPEATQNRPQSDRRSVATQILASNGNLPAVQKS